MRLHLSIATSVRNVLRMSVPQISLVVPVHNEAGNIQPLVAEIRTALSAAAIEWELFIVDDGSTDGSWEELSAATADSRVRGIRLEQRLGKSAALVAGFQICSAAQIVMLDGDGQDDPGEIPKMVALLASTAADQGNRADLVNGWKTPRLDPWHKTFPSWVFNLLVGWLTGLKLHDHNCGLKAFRREVIEAIVLQDNFHRFIPVLAAAQGFRVVEMPVHHRPRTRGSSKYGMSRFFRGLFDLVRVAAMVRRTGQLAARRQRPLSRARLRQSVYAILAVLALGAVLGRIGAVSSVDTIALEKRLVADQVAASIEQVPVDADRIRHRVETEKRLARPFLSANDRSRWLTIRALVEQGTFTIDGLVTEPGWDTIDAVVHPDSSGKLRLYSSKPPLLSVLLAGFYWLLHAVSGWTLGDHPFEMGRLLMVLYGLVPLGITIHFTCRLIDAIGTSDWGRIWAAALICCGTMLTTFAVVLTNHIPAAACTAASAWLLYRIRCDGVRSWWHFATAGLCLGLAAALDLPAIAWMLAAFVVLARCDWRRTACAALPAALLVGCAFFGTNWLAHGTFAPPYAHRKPAASGQPHCCELPSRAALSLSGAATGAALESSTNCWNPDNWYDYSLVLSNGKTLVSYWRTPRGIDRGEPSAWTYAWHSLLGHHGIFALTPAWLLVIPGLMILVRRPPHRAGQAELAWAVVTVSTIVIAFYLLRPQSDRNYGGMTSGFRWVFWLAPLWVVASLPAVDRLAQSRLGRCLALMLLLISVASVAYPTWNPWTSPWIQNWLVHGGWIKSP